MLKEFREFAIKGNMIDLAVGIIIGAAFGGVVKALVDYIIMPPIGILTGGIDFTNKFLVLRDQVAGGGYKTLEEASKAGAVVIAYGAFLTTLINFLIVAFAVFLVVKAVNKMRREQPTPVVPPAPTAEEKLLTEIRDLLQKG